jgi:hypothetical protein
MTQSWISPAMVISARRMTRTIAVAGRTNRGGYKLVGAPNEGGPDYMKEGSVTVGRAGRLSVHTWVQNVP